HSEILPIFRNIQQSCRPWLPEFCFQEQNLAPNMGLVSGQLLSTRRTIRARRVLDGNRGGLDIWKVISILTPTSRIVSDEKSNPVSLRFSISPCVHSSWPSLRWRNGI